MLREGRFEEAVARYRRVVAARPYAAALAEVIADLYSPELAERFALLRQPGPGGVKRAALVVLTANRGLCGAFNANLIREGRRWLQELEAAGAVVDLHLVGKKGVGFFRFTGRGRQPEPISTRPSESRSPISQRY